MGEKENQKASQIRGFPSCHCPDGLRVQGFSHYNKLYSIGGQDNHHTTVLGRRVAGILPDVAIHSQPEGRYNVLTFGI
jgi:hypothetical protein